MLCFDPIAKVDWLVTAPLQDEIDYDYAVNVAERAMRHMSQHRIPPTPDNFKVWAGYAQGVPASLKRTIDVLIGNKRTFDAQTNRDLVATFAESGPGVASASQQLSTVVDAAREFLSTAIADNKSQIKTIGDTAGAVSGGADPKLLVESLVKELNRAANRASELEQNFAASSRELDTIRNSLEKAEERSKTDMLTGLPNRRAFDEFLRLAQTAAMEKGDPLGLLLIDVDHFKRFNDGFGHNVGDQVLKLLGGVLKERVRENDLAARYGGEELIVVLPAADMHTCAAVAERIRKSIAEAKITRRATGEALPGITVSIGVAQFRPGEPASEFIERCDNALYAAKSNGRNRVMTEHQLGSDLLAS